MIGEKHGFLKIIEDMGSDKYHIKQVKVVCDCGKEKVVAYSSLKQGKVRSCGCKRAELRGETGFKRRETKELTIGVVKNRINFLRNSLEYLKGKTPKEMTKAEYLDFYMTNARICELQELIGEE